MKRRIVGLSIAFGIFGSLALLARPLDLHISLTRGTSGLTAGVHAAPAVALAQTAQDGLESLRSQSKAFVSIAKEVLPSVVTIVCEKTVQVTGMPGQGNPGLFADPFFGRFFQQEPNRIPETGTGSGVVVRRDGYILTNNHVVRDADKIRVTLEDGRAFDAEVVGTDPKSDVAVIKIKADGLDAAKLGNSDQLEVGEWVLAVGNPFQLSSTVTAGIVSAVGRSNIGLADYEDFIQTDAAINPGNSGGALVNLDGDVVGINTAIASRNGGNQGIGFAIPINMAGRIMDSLISHGKVVRGWMGVSIQNINDTTAEIFGMDRPHGALVGQVTPASPAEDAGIRQGDVIVSIDGEQVKDVEDLQLKIVDHDPGAKVDLGILRDGKERSITIELGELPADEAAKAEDGGERGSPSSRSTDLLGMSLEELTRPVRTELDIPPGVEGLLVTDVDPAKPAGRAGLQRGDIIMRVGNDEILSLRSFEEAVKGARLGKPVLFLVRRGDTESFLGIRIPE
jgi:serine protease Do